MTKNKLTVPKRVAGVKVPKTLRKQAKKAVRLADNPAVRELAVAALGAAALKIAESTRKHETVKTAAKKTKRQIEVAEEDVVDAAAELRREAMKLGDLVRAAALEGARRLLEKLEEAGRQASDGKPGARGS